MQYALALAYANAARDFFVAASHLLNFPSATPLPALFLLARSIELALKSLLLSSGVSQNQLSKEPFRHDIIAAYKEALRKNALPADAIGSIEFGALELLSKEYSSTRLSYADFDRPYHLPRIDLIDSIAKTLLDICNPNE
jgi:hypothetical protein